jgi:hypothetical protein
MIFHTIFCYEFLIFKVNRYDDIITIVHFWEWIIL